MINNRQAGRRRGRGGNNNNNGPRQGGQQGNGSRIDSRARGNATQLYEKYKNMASDAQRSGDRVTTEYYLQFADHYFRVLSEQRGQFEERQPRRASNEFDMDGAGDDGDEFGDEGEPVRGNEQGEGPRFQGDGPRFESQDRGQDRSRDDRPRDDRPRDDRPREFRRDEGGEARRPNGDGRREWQDRPTGNRQDGNRPDTRADGIRQDDRQDVSRADRQRERRPVEATAGADVGGQHRADAIAPGESLTGRAEEVLAADRPLDAPRRRGRPRRDALPVALADDDAGDAFDAQLAVAMKYPAGERFTWSEALPHLLQK